MVAISRCGLPETVPFAIVNDMMARRNFPDQSPLGKRFRFAEHTVVREITGVVKTANYTTLDEEQHGIFLVSQGYCISPRLFRKMLLLEFFFAERQRRMRIDDKIYPRPDASPRSDVVPHPPERWGGPPSV